ncbi:MAG: pro-sigmaK processing inhibitor BofA family protein [Candidatus Diapherotrites archaeon]|nr:pro-sigmaK processing inhibitor BofA family protein [Candidatus Diapherotrites archaeon]
MAFNATVNATAPLQLFSTNGIVVFVIGAMLVIVTGYIIYKVVKQLILNSIIGGIGLIVMHFVAPYIGYEVQINALNILIALIAGLPGLVIIALMVLFGIK